MATEILPKAATEALAAYSPTDAAIEKMRAEYMPLVVVGIEDKRGAQKAHDARMVVRGHRVAIEKTRVALKADALAFGRAVDGEAKRLTGMLEPIEDHLLAQEEIVTKEAERVRAVEEAKRQAVIRDRMTALSRVRSPLTTAEVERMSDAVFDIALAEATQAHTAAVDAERVAAESRKLEQERIDREREQLALERAEADRIAAEQRAVLDRERAAQQAESDRLAAERAKIDADKAAAARAAELKAAQDRAAAEALERQRAEAERAEAERQRRESMRPTVEKLHALAVAVESLTVPEFQASAEVRQSLARAAQEIRAIAAR